MALILPLSLLLTVGGYMKAKLWADSAFRLLFVWLGSGTDSILSEGQRVKKRIVASCFSLRVMTKMDKGRRKKFNPEESDCCISATLLPLITRAHQYWHATTCQASGPRGVYCILEYKSSFHSFKTTQTWGCGAYSFKHYSSTNGICEDWVKVWISNEK